MIMMMIAFININSCYRWFADIFRTFELYGDTPGCLHRMRRPFLGYGSFFFERQ